MVKRVYLMFFDQIFLGKAYSILSSYNVHIIRLLGKSFCHNAKMFINNKDFHGPWQFISAASGFTREYWYTSSLTFFFAKRHLDLLALLALLFIYPSMSSTSTLQKITSQVVTRSDVMLYETSLYDTCN